MKRCTGCGKGPSEVEFYTNVRPTSRCKGCVREYNAQRRAPVVIAAPVADAACELDALTRAWTLPGFVAPAHVEAEDLPSEVEIAAANLKAAA